MEFFLSRETWISQMCVTKSAEFVMLLLMRLDL